MKTKTRVFLLVGAVVVLAVIVVFLVRRPAPPEAAAEAETPPSALVETQPAGKGALEQTVVAYGTAVPAINGALTLSVPVEGRVMRIDVTPGEAVKAGQALLEFHLSAAADSTYQQAVTALKVARDQQQRTERLLGEQLATGEQKAQADKAVADAKAAVAALERETGGKPQQTITAPFDGIVGAVPVAQGDRVAAGAALATVTRNRGLVVTVGIEPDQLGSIKLGQQVKLKALDGAGKEQAGRVVRIDKSLNPKTRLIDADIAADGEMLQGEAFRADIDVGNYQGWVVPRGAVLDDDEGAYVFQVAGGKAVRVAVQRVGSNDATTVVDGPLDAERAVVVVGNYQLEDGMAVRMAAKAATAAAETTAAKAKAAARAAAADVSGKDRTAP
jgi:RND family efflux transporter MFP subunit